MTAVGHISDTKEIVKPSCLLFQHDGAAGSKSSERSPLPRPLSAENLLTRRTQILNVCGIPRINHPPVESDEDSAPERSLDTETWLNWNGDLDNPNDSGDDCTGDVESDIEQGNRIEDPECPDKLEVSAAPNVPGWIWPTQKLQRKAEKLLMMVNAIEMRRNKGVKNK